MDPELPKLINHFTIQIPFPEKGTLTAYKSAHTSTKGKKNKHKFNKFIYYRLNQQQIIKVLYKDDDTFLLQGKYPFTDPETKLCEKEELKEAKKVIKTEAAYIGHLDNKMIILKKLEGVKVAVEGKQFQTVDDNFEVIEMGNPQRFQQFTKILGISERTLQMSIRVIIDESNPEKPYILDYEFFHREDQLKKSKVYNGKVGE